MSKQEAGTAAAPQVAGENLIAALRRLHREYLASVRERAAEGERRVGAALESCMGEMARIEDDATAAIRKASTEYQTAARAAADAPVSAQYWDYQRRVSETTTAAGARADAARKAYIDAWKAAEEEVAALGRKGRLDYLARVQQAWRAVDVEKLDPATAELLVRILDTVFNETAIR